MVQVRYCNRLRVLTHRKVQFPKRGAAGQENIDCIAEKVGYRDVRLSVSVEVTRCHVVGIYANNRHFDLRKEHLSRRDLAADGNNKSQSGNWSAPGLG